MNVRLAGFSLAACLIGVAGQLLGAAKDDGAGGTATPNEGDVNVVNAQISIGGKSVSAPAAGVVVGNGRRVTMAVPVAAAFHGLDLSGVFITEVVCGSAAVVEVVIDENLQRLLVATVHDGLLRVRFTKPVQTKSSPHLKIVLPALDVLQMSGGDTVGVVNMKGPRFRLTHSGTGAVTLSGQVEDFVCTVSGIGEVDASKLACRTAEVAISGVGGVTCRPENKLKASLTGIGGVSCLTQPAKVEKQITGLGDVAFVKK